MDAMIEPDDGVYAANTRVMYTRRSDLARYDAGAINSTIDEALFCHVGYVDDGDPIVVPVIHTRVDETLYLHTSSGSRLDRLAAGGTRLCVTISLLDGLVLGRSQVNHNVNYRSVVIRGEGVQVTDEQEKQAAWPPWWNTSRPAAPGTPGRRPPANSPRSRWCGCRWTTSPSSPGRAHRTTRPRICPPITGRE